MRRMRGSFAAIRRVRSALALTVAALEIRHHPRARTFPVRWRARGIHVRIVIEDDS